MQTQITVTSTRHHYGDCAPSIGGIGGFSYVPESTTVVWSDGTLLEVEDQHATATYRGHNYKLPRIDSSLHGNIVTYWTRLITKRLQRDTAPSPSLTGRVREGWKSPQSSAD